MVKVLPLEGPHKKHHNHGSDASHPKSGKGPVAPSQHWEIRYSTNAPSQNMKATEGSDFAPKRACDRKTTYMKVNETDH